MLLTEQTPPTPRVVARLNGRDISIPFTNQMPQPPYLALHWGGRDYYNALIDPSSNEAVSSIKLRCSNNLRSPTKMVTIGKEMAIDYMDIDYGNGTVEMQTHYSTDCAGTVFYPTDVITWYDSDKYESEYDVPYDDPLAWDDPDMSYAKARVTWELDVATQIFNKENYDIYIRDDTPTTFKSYDINFGRYFGNGTFSCFNEGDSILIHHSALKVAPSDVDSDMLSYYAGKWDVATITSVDDYYSDGCSAAGGRIPNMKKLTLDNYPDIDLDNFYVQAVPFVDLKTLSVCKGLTIRPASYSYDEHCGGIVAIRCNGTFHRDSPSVGISGDYGIEFTGGHIVLDGSLPLGSAVFVFAPDIITYNIKYENQDAPYNSPIVYIDS